MKLSKQEIEHIAGLARLELSDEEIKLYGEQLSGILSYVDQLKEVDTSGVEPTAQITGIANALRQDETGEWDKEETEDALRQAAQSEGRQIKVKRIL
jgi:aspartyl-tRNA(Asn)/glutamyl-tRNA(Gln) amidotransferase subunit C